MHNAFGNMRKLELLAPAKNLECGMAAIEHGADAVYIGAMRFGARAAAGNSVEDIGKLCCYAHPFGAKVYVTVNTIVFDDELNDTQRLIKELQSVGVDALLVQDMGILENGMTLHASTQTDNRTVEKVRWLRAQGFRRVVLARELSLEEIRQIHAAVPDVELEVFVHGALCVSYSGVCYASQYCLGRSANRGECAQMCRMKYDLLDAAGQEIEHQRHFLSLKDLCQIDHLEELADAGATSFKIEGRLKDVDYVKNVVAAYSQRLDALCRRRPQDYERASLGRVEYSFEPNLKKTFNRGYTTYFLNGRQTGIASFDTPKALGEYVGTVKSISFGGKAERGRRREERLVTSMVVAGTASFSNGDGLCFFKRQEDGSCELVGFRVNRAQGNRLFPLKMPEGLREGMSLYRNNDEAFAKLMTGKTAERRLPVSMRFGETPEGFCLTMSLLETNGTIGTSVSCSLPLAPKALAEKPQRENIIRQLTKLGNTVLRCEQLEIVDDADRFFIPSSALAALRRNTVERMLHAVSQQGGALAHERDMEESSSLAIPVPGDDFYQRYPYLYNVANASARQFYREHGLQKDERAFELRKERGGDLLLMQCRHCIRFSLGYCVKHGGKRPTWREPLSLRLAVGCRFRLEFDCADCQMNVYSIEN